MKFVSFGCDRHLLWHPYANENFPLPVVEELRRLGHDILTIQETGRAGQALPDKEILAQVPRGGPLG